MVRAYVENRGALRTKEGNGNESTSDKEEGKIIKLRGCRLMKCMNVLHGCVCRRSSTSHRRRDRKKKIQHLK